MSIDADLKDVPDPAVAAGILVARARSHAANGQHQKLAQTLEAIDRILSGMRNDATLPFVWRTIAPNKEVRGVADATEAPLIERIVECDPKCSSMRREQTTDTCIDDCSYFCGDLLRAV